MPSGVIVDASGNVLVADQSDHRVRLSIPRESSARWRVTVWGLRKQARSPVTERADHNASLNNPTAIAEDAAGNLYIADQFNQRIREVNTAGIIRTIAGNGSAGFAGDGVRTRGISELSRRADRGCGGECLLQRRSELPHAKNHGCHGDDQHGGRQWRAGLFRRRRTRYRSIAQWKFRRYPRHLRGTCTSRIPRIIAFERFTRERRPTRRQPLRPAA